MLYTQRRADHPDPGPGVAWVHGSRVGVARSDDGLAWTYVGTLEPSPDGLDLTPGPPPSEVDRTHWAPDLIRVGDEWRMYLTEIDGVPDRWEGHGQRIVEYRSDDLRRFRRRGPIGLGSDRVIDAAVARVGDRCRMWFKDEAAHSDTRTAVSDDLESWTTDGIAIGGRPHEGPFVFPLGGWFWMIVDQWRGMGKRSASGERTDRSLPGCHGEVRAAGGGAARGSGGGRALDSARDAAGRPRGGRCPRASVHRGRRLVDATAAR